MNEQDVIKMLLGEAGGIFAFGIVVGVFLTWTANIRIVTPHIQRAHEAELNALHSKIEQMEARHREQLVLLEARIKELEKFERDYMAVLHNHADGSLKLPKTQ